MKTKTWAILLIALCTLLTSSAQILYKWGVPSLQFNLHSILTDYYILAGLFLYAIGAMLMLIAFKGGEVTVLYPIFATSYIWVAILSYFFFQEPLSFFKIIGILIIMGGITCIAYGNSSSKNLHVEGVN